MLPTLTMSFVAGLLLGSQILYFPLSTSFPLLLSALGAFALERRNLVSIRQATCLYGALLAGVAYWSVVANLSSHGSMVGYSPWPRPDQVPNRGARTVMLGWRSATPSGYGIPHGRSWVAG